MFGLLDVLEEVYSFRFLFKIPSNKPSLLILNEVFKERLDVQSIARRLNLSQTYVYDLVKALEKTRLIDYSIKDGKKIFGLSDKCLAFLNRILEDLKMVFSMLPGA